MELVKLAVAGELAAAKAIGWKAQTGDAPPPGGPSSALRIRLGLPAPELSSLGPPPADPPAASGVGAPAPSKDAVRTLWVEIDDHGIRRKNWCDVVVES